MHSACVNHLSPGIHEIGCIVKFATPAAVDALGVLGGFKFCGRWASLAPLNYLYKAQGHMAAAVPFWNQLLITDF